ncbi:hypothetical protein GCM10023115_06220 [Pontixanthobacter gangjinensis]|uniref:MYXO-CTERM domain-containing protein n=1 Tax=Pontixanthobacter gangjinensis TaxID=1028742 RepID=A0A6I4SJ44_9SPHN|nr:hypothetical protein [Pontixanthobacter gangjinensis]MXO55871.1 hypothetical protein [Pontixanthobacter gangjinensis]
MIKSSLALLASITLLFASTAAHAEVRPTPTAFAIMINDDYVEEEPVGWLWAGVGVMTALGLLVLLSGGGNGGNSPT